MKQSKNLVLLFGATGQTGIHIAQKLISEGHPIRVLVRSKEKLKKIFGERQISFEKIIEGSITDKDKLKQAFQRSQHFGDVKIVISALGARPFDKQRIQEIQYFSHVNIVDLCKQKNVQKYILVSAALMTRPWNLITIFLNTLIRDCMHWKSKAQNYIRQSGINYVIIRPPQLVGNKEDREPTGFTIDQGDRIGGRISRATLSEIIYESMLNRTIPEKVTFQCLMNKGRGCQQSKAEEFNKLKPDDEKTIVRASHVLARRVCNYSFLISMIGIGAYLASVVITKQAQQL